MGQDRDFYDQAKRDMERDGVQPSVEDLMTSIDRYVTKSIEASQDLLSLEHLMCVCESRDYYRERMRLNLEGLLPTKSEGAERESTDPDLPAIDPEDFM